MDLGQIHIESNMESTIYYILIQIQTQYRHGYYNSHSDL